MANAPGSRLSLALAGILCLVTALMLHGDTPATAKVKVDSLNVHRDASEESEVVTTLKKGHEVVVGIQIQNSESIWCQVREPGADAWLGYVTCRQLELPPPPPSPKPPESGESYSGVQLLIGKSEHSKPEPGAGGRPAAPPVTDRRFLSRDVDAPDFALSDLDGNTHVLGSQRGRTVLLDFWATWCGPCREEMPHLEKLRHELGGRGLTVWSINSGESPELVRRFFERTGYTGTILLDTDSRVNQEYDARYIPTLVIVDPAGKVRFYDSGVYTADELRAALAQLGLR